MRKKWNLFACSTLKYQIEVMKNRMKRMGSGGDADAGGGPAGGESMIGEEPFDTTSSSSFRSGLIDRSLWLTGLLVFQSCSSFILQANQSMINDHPAVIYFLTMLVGEKKNIVHLIILNQYSTLFGFVLNILRLLCYLSLILFLFFTVILFLSFLIAIHSFM